MSVCTGLCVLKLSINLVLGVIIISQATIATTLFVLKKKKQQKEAGKEWEEGTDVWRKDEKREKKSQRM